MSLETLGISFWEKDSDSASCKKLRDNSRSSPQQSHDLRSLENAHFR